MPSNPDLAICAGLPRCQSFLQRAPLAVFLLAVWAWLGALFPGGFAFDDTQAILESPYVRGDLPLQAAFTQDYWHHIGDAGHYRPLASLSLRMDYKLYGEWSPGYHLTSILLHGLTAALACLLALRLVRSTREAFACVLGLAIFAIHPGLADAVAWISARSSSLAVLPGLLVALALFELLSRRSLSSPIRFGVIGFSISCALLMGLFGKEDGMVSAVFPALVIARDWQKKNDSKTRDLLGIGLGVLLGLFAYGYLRQHALGSAIPSAPHAPLAGVPLTGRMQASGAALVEAAQLFLAPFQQTPNYRAQDWLSNGVGTALLGWSMWLTSFASGLLFLAREVRSRRGEFVLAFALLGAPLAAVPVLQFLPAGEVFAGRFLYTPMLLGLPALGYLIIHFMPVHGSRFQLIPRVLGPFILVGATWGCWDSAEAYESKLAYETAVLKRFPADALAWNGLGLAQEENGDSTSARESWEKALAADESYGRPHSNLGRLDLQDHNEAGALSHFQSAAEKGPGNPVAWCNLGALQLRMKDFAHARVSYTRATKIAPGMSAAWSGLGRAYAETNELELARAALDKAIRFDPKNVAALSTRVQFELID